MTGNRRYVSYVLVSCLLAALFVGVSTTACSPLLKAIGFKKCAPVYGNWCGENYPLLGFNPRPVDRWDAACRDHDRCYDEGDGDSDRKLNCDNRFLRTLNGLNDGRPVPQEMRNAFSWFSKRYTNSVFVWAPAKDNTWSMAADCEGGDGQPAQFCIYRGGYCEMARDGNPGTPCSCATPMGWIPGVIRESR